MVVVMVTLAVKLMVMAMVITYYGDDRDNGDGVSKGDGVDSSSDGNTHCMVEDVMGKVADVGQLL